MSVYCDTGIYTSYFQMRKIVSFKYTRYLFVSATSLFSADSSSSRAMEGAMGVRLGG